MKLTEGALMTGENSVRVEFETQIRYPSFVGQEDYNTLSYRIKLPYNTVQ